MRSFLLVALVSLLICGCRPSLEGESTASQSGAAPSGSSTGQPAADGLDSDRLDVDNTALNARDRDGSAPTPIDQGQGQDDINTTATIRKRVVEQAISINGQNVKIITRDGKVTLRGPVKTEDEKQLIERIAHEVAGAENVTSMLDVERE